MTSFNESVVENAALEYFAELGYQTVFGPNITPDAPDSERSSFMTGQALIIDGGATARLSTE